MTAAVKNERLRKRFAQWDVNGNGRIEKSDYEAEAHRIIDAFGEDQSSPKARAVRDTFGKMFEYLANKAGVGPNGSMDEEQFVRVVEAEVFSEGDSGFDRVVGPTIRAIVGLCDQDGDGEVDRSEFNRWLDAVGVDRSSATSAFNAIDTDGSGKLSVDELVNAVRNFHLGRLDVPLLGR